MDFHADGTVTLTATEVSRVEDALIGYQDASELTVAVGREVEWSAASDAYALAKQRQHEAGWRTAETLEEIGFGE